MKRFCVTIVCLLVLSVAGQTFAGPITELVVFGDSLSDAGNDLATLGLPGAPGYYNGRFADGPVWVDQLATQLGVSVATPSVLAGTNYAYGGAETGPGSSFLSPLIPNMGTQIDDYLTAGNVPVTSQLFVVFGGHNNFRGGELDPAVPVADIVDHITTLATAGAQRFLTSTIMPLGQLPETNGGPNEALADALALQFNNLLAAELDTLRTTLGITIHEFDTHGIMQSMIANPAAFGLTNVTDPVYVGDPGYLGGGSTVGDPAEYLFWDEVHPSAAAQSFFADAAFAAVVPEPSSLALTGLAVLGFAGLVRRGRKSRAA